MTDYTRRQALRFGLVSGVAGGIAGRGRAVESHTIVVSNVGRDEQATYEFGVSGSVSTLSNPSGDYTDGSRAWGSIHGWKDGYEFTGEVTSFTHDGDVDVFVDGTEVDPAMLGADGSAGDTHEVVVSNVGRDEEATYEFGVSGSVSTLSNPSGDYTDGSRAWGSVHGWKDGYEYTGEITSFVHDGVVRVYVDGTEVDPSAFDGSGGDTGGDDSGDSGDGDATERSLVVSNVGSEARTSYELEVTGSIDAVSDPSGDYTDGSRAWGSVHGWKDGYEFTGEVTAFDADGPVTVYVDGEAVDPATLDGSGDDGSDRNPPNTPERGAIRRRGTPLHDMDDWGDWSPYGSGNAAAGDGTTAYTGSRSLRVESGGGRLGARYDPASTVDLAGKRLSVALNWESPRVGGIDLSVYLYDYAGRRSDYGVRFRGEMIGSEQGWVRCPVYKKLGGRANADLSAVSSIRLSSWPGDAGRFWIDDLRLHDLPSRGKVAFTFDDGSRSHRLAIDYLSERGVAGTLFPMVNKLGESPRLTLADLNEAKAAGWAVGSHPQFPQSLADMDATTAAMRMDENRRWLADRGFDPELMSWPYGAYDSDALLAADERHDLVFSGNGTPTSAEIGFPLTVGRNDATDAAGAKAAIDRAAQYGELAVLAYHGIGTHGRWDVSIEHFEEAVDHAIAADVDVITCADLLP